MASTFITVSAPFVSYRRSFHPHTKKCSPGLKAMSLKVNAIATKYELAKVVPQADRVLIRIDDLPEKSVGRVLLTKSSVQYERYLVGEVLSVGADAVGLEKGQQVMFSDINAYEVDLGTDGKHVFCKAGDLLAVVK